MAERRESVVWKDVVGYEGIYSVNTMGEVKSHGKYVDIGLGRQQFKPERILKPAKGSHGYLAVALCKNKKQASTCIHTILAMAFIPNPDAYQCINHKNGIKSDNSVENLEWVTYAQNSQHAYDTGLRKPHRKITSQHVIEIRALHKNLGLRVNQLSALYSANHSTVSEIVRFKLRING